MYKILFPGGYNISDELDDNTDVHVVFDNERVFVGTMFTLTNIRSLMTENNQICFWASDMIIVDSLSKEMIRTAVTNLINDRHFEYAFSEIGTIQTIYHVNTYDELIDMTL